jgi:hypothetical protein
LDNLNNILFFVSSVIGGRACRIAPAATQCTLWITRLSSPFDANELRNQLADLFLPLPTVKSNIPVPAKDCAPFDEEFGKSVLPTDSSDQSDALSDMLLRLASPALAKSLTPKEKVKESILIGQAQAASMPANTIDLSLNQLLPTETSALKPASSEKANTNVSQMHVDASQIKIQPAAVALRLVRRSDDDQFSEHVAFSLQFPSHGAAAWAFRRLKVRASESDRVWRLQHGDRRVKPASAQVLF